MVTQIAAVGGQELLLMLVSSATMVAIVVTAIYGVVRLATRPRSVRVEDEHNELGDRHG